jgi:hypothetical protein
MRAHPSSQTKSTVDLETAKAKRLDTHRDHEVRVAGSGAVHTDYRRPYSTYRDAFDAARGLFFFSHSPKDFE